jgi:hypothetical protein
MIGWCAQRTKREHKSDHRGDELDLFVSGRFWASSKRRMRSSHAVVLQILLETCLMASGNKVIPASCSTFSTGRYVSIHSRAVEKRHSLGAAKLSSGVVSEITAFGRMKAPVEISGMSGVLAEEGRDVSTTWRRVSYHWAEKVLKAPWRSVWGRPHWQGFQLPHASGQARREDRLKISASTLTTRHLPSGCCCGIYRGTVKT